MTSSAAVEPGGLDDRVRRRLLDVALAAVGEELTTGRPWTVPPAGGEDTVLDRPGASFVTLERDGRLLGCIGSVEPRRSLVADVAANARGAAFDDPRLPAVTAADWPTMAVKVSVLSPLEPMPAESARVVAGWLRPGVDGILLTAGRSRATFLPSVWEKLPDVESFLGRLLWKAGLSMSTWPADARVWRYQTEEFADPGPRPPLDG